MLQTLTRYITSKRLNAVWVAFASVMVVLVSPLAYIVMSLVTLHRGVRAGFEIALVVLLASTGFALFVNFYNPGEDITISLGLALFTIANCYIGAVVMKKYKSCYLCLQAICLMSIAFVIIGNLFLHDLATYWIHITDERIRIARTLFPSVQPAVPFSPGQLAYAKAHVFGMYSLIVVLSSIGYLFTARVMQAKTFDQAKLQPLYQMRADYAGIIIAAVIYLGSYFEIFIAEEILYLTLLPLMMTGLSVVHHYALGHKRHWILIVCFYLMFLSFPEIMFYGLVLLAGADVFINIRGLYNGYNTTRNDSRRKS